MTQLPKKRRPRKPKVKTEPIVFHQGDVVDCGIPGQSVRGVIFSRGMVGEYWVVQTKTGHHLYMPSEMRKVEDNGQDH